MLRADVATAGALASAFSVSRPAVSRHLRVLREAGLVEQRVRGREREYRSQLSALVELEAYLRELRSPPDLWQRRFDALATEVQRRRRRRRAAESERKPENPRAPARQRRKETA